MLKRTSMLAAAHTLAVIGFAFFVGTFTDRSGTLQFFGHLGPVILLASAGLISISGRMALPRLIRIEAYMALGVAFVYLLVDSFIIHPPLGIFDGAGATEQQHVSLFLMLGGLALFVLATLGQSLFDNVHVFQTGLQDTFFQPGECLWQWLKCMDRATRIR